MVVEKEEDRWREERWKRTTVLRARKSVIRSRRVADAENIHHARGALSPPVDLRFIITFSPARAVPPPLPPPLSQEPALSRHRITRYTRDRHPLYVHRLSGKMRAACLPPRDLFPSIFTLILINGS